MLTTIFILWLAFIATMVWLDYRQIVKRRKSPHHKLQFFLRCIGGALFVIAGLFLLEREFFWTMPIMLPFTFWFLFDTGLNLSRGKKAWYLDEPGDPEEDSSIDEFFVRKVGRDALFVLWMGKFFLAAVGTILYFYGWGAVVAYQY